MEHFLQSKYKKVAFVFTNVLYYIAPDAFARAFYHQCCVLTNRGISLAHITAVAFLQYYSDFALGSLGDATFQCDENVHQYGFRAGDMFNHDRRYEEYFHKGAFRTPVADYSIMSTRKELPLFSSFQFEFSVRAVPFHEEVANPIVPQAQPALPYSYRENDTLYSGTIPQSLVDGISAAYRYQSAISVDDIISRIGSLSLAGGSYYSESAVRAMATTLLDVFQKGGLPIYSRNRRTRWWWSVLIAPLVLLVGISCIMRRPFSKLVLIALLANAALLVSYAYPRIYHRHPIAVQRILPHLPPRSTLLKLDGALKNRTVRIVRAMDVLPNEDSPLQAGAHVDLSHATPNLHSRVEIVGGLGLIDWPDLGRASPHVFDTSIPNVTAALYQRHLGMPPNLPLGGEWAHAMRMFRGLFGDELGHIPPYSLQAWLHLPGRLPKIRILTTALTRLYGQACMMFQPANRYFMSMVRKSFIKKEIEPYDPSKEAYQDVPRLIQGSSEEWQALLGPFIAAFSTKFADYSQHRRDGEFCASVYASGLTPAGLGSWFEYVTRRRGLNYFVETDCSRWDSTIPAEACLAVVDLFEHWGLPHDFCSVMRRDVKSFRGVIRECNISYVGHGTVRSGDPHTSLGNSLMNLAVMHAMRVRFDLNTSYAIAMGDDSLLAMNEEDFHKVSGASIRAFYARFGLTAKVKLLSSTPPSFCSKLFYHYNGSYIAGPLPHRFMARFGWSVVQYGTTVDEVLGRMKGGIQSQGIIAAYIPIIQSIAQSVYACADNIPAVIDTADDSWRTIAPVEELDALERALNDTTIRSTDYALNARLLAAYYAVPLTIVYSWQASAIRDRANVTVAMLTAADRAAAALRQ